MPSIEFLPLAVNPSDYPVSRFSMLPTVRRGGGLRGRAEKVKSAFLGDAEFFVYGRYALVEALKRAGAGPGRAVLLPAYHCRTIVESVLHVGAEARFYPMTTDLRPDFANMGALVSDGKASTFLMTHYFGFANALAEAKAYCESAGIAFIEDCAHAFYGEQGGSVLGTVGDYAIASAWKFLPVWDGAMLRDNTMPSRKSGLKPQPFSEEIRAMRALVNAWLEGRRRKPVLPALSPQQLVEGAAEIHGGQSRMPKEDPSGFRARLVGAAGCSVSRWAVLNSPHDDVAEKRRQNYQHWLNGIQRFPGVRPLFSSLPDGVAPYAFPLLTDAEGLVFHALKLAGIPIWRWEDVARTTCPVAQDYRLRLLQLPCHQDLRAEEVDWMLEILGGVLSAMFESGDLSRKKKLA